MIDYGHFNLELKKLIERVTLEWDIRCIWNLILDDNFCISLKKFISIQGKINYRNKSG